MDVTDENAAPVPRTPEKEFANEGQMQNKRRPLESPFSSVTPSQRRPLKQNRFAQQMEGDANLEETVLEESRLDVTIANETMPDLSLMEAAVLSNDEEDEVNRTSTIDDTQTTEIGASLADELGALNENGDLDGSVSNGNDKVEPELDSNCVDSVSAPSLEDELAALKPVAATEDSTEHETFASFRIDESAAIDYSLDNTQKTEVGLAEDPMPAVAIPEPASTDASSAAAIPEPASTDASSAAATPIDSGDEDVPDDLYDDTTTAEEGEGANAADVSRLDASLTHSTADHSIMGVDLAVTEADTSIAVDTVPNALPLSDEGKPVEEDSNSRIAEPDNCSPGETDVDEVEEEKLALDMTQADPGSLFGNSAPSAVAGGDDDTSRDEMRTEAEMEAQLGEVDGATENGSLVDEQALDADSTIHMFTSRPSSSTSNRTDITLYDEVDMDITNAVQTEDNPSEGRLRLEETGATANTTQDSSMVDTSVADVSSCITGSSNLNQSKSSKKKKSKKSKKAKAIPDISPIVSSPARVPADVPECVTPTPAMAAYSGTDIDPSDAVMSVRTPRTRSSSPSLALGHASSMRSSTSSTGGDVADAPKKPTSRFTIPDTSKDLLENTVIEAPIDNPLLSESCFEFVQEENGVRLAAIEKYEAEIAVLRSALEVASLECNKPSNTEELAELTSAKAALQEALAAKDKEIDYLRKDVDGLNFMLEENKRRTKKQLTELGNLNREQEQSIIDLKAKLEMSHEFANSAKAASSDEMDKKLFEKETQISVLQSELDTAQKRIAALSSELSAERERDSSPSGVDAREESANLLSELTKKNTDLELLMATLQKQLDTATSQLDSANQRADAAQADAAELEKKLETANKDMEVSSTAWESESLRSADLQAKLAEMEKRTVEMEADLAESKQKLQTLASDSSQQSHEAAERISDLQAQVERVEAEVAEKQSMVADMEKTIKELTSERDALSNDVVTVRARATQSEEELRQMTADSSDIRETCERLQSAVDKEAAEFTARLEQAEALRKDLEQKLTEVSQERDSLGADKQELEEKIRLQYETISSLELSRENAVKEATERQTLVIETSSMLEEAKTQLVAMETDAELRKEELSALKEQSGQHAERVADLESQLKSISGRVDTAEGALQLAKEEELRTANKLAACESELEQARDQLSQLQVEWEKAREDLVASTSKLEMLASESGVLTAKVEQLQSELQSARDSSSERAEEKEKELARLREDSANKDALLQQSMLDCQTAVTRVDELEAEAARKALEVAETARAVQDELLQAQTCSSASATRLADVEGELLALQTTHSQTELKLKEAEESHARMAERVSSLEAQLKDKIEEADERTSAATQLASDLEKASSALADKEAAVGQLAAQLNEHAQKIVELETAVASSGSAVVAKLQSKIAEYENVVSMGKSQMAKLKEEKSQVVLDLENTRALSLAELEKASNETEQMRKQLNEMNLELESLKASSADKLSELENDVTGKQAEIDRLYKEMDEFDEIEGKLLKQLEEQQKELRELKEGGSGGQSGLLSAIKQGSDRLTSSAQNSFRGDVTQPIRIGDEAMAADEDEEEDGVADFSSVPSTPTKASDVTLATNSAQTAATPLYKRQLDSTAAAPSPSVANRSGCTQQ